MEECMRNVKIMALVALLFCISFTGLAGICGKPSEMISVNVEDVALEKLEMEQMTLLVTLLVNNRYQVGVTLPKMGFGVQIENNLLFETESVEEIQINANGSSDVPFNVKMIYEDIYNIAQAVKDKAEFQYKIEGWVEIDLSAVPGAGEMLGVQRLPFSHTGMMPNIDLDIAVENIDVNVQTPSTQDAVEGLTGMFGGGGGGQPNITPTVDIEFDIVVVNKTAANIQFNGINYNIKLGSQNILDGRSTEFTATADGTGRLHVQNTIDVQSSVLSAISGARNYECNGTLMINLQAPFGQQAVDFSVSGSF